MLFCSHTSSVASLAGLTYRRTTVTANLQTAKKWWGMVFQWVEIWILVKCLMPPGLLPHSPSRYNSRMGRISCLLAFVDLRQSPFWIIFGSQDVQCACADMISREFGMQMKLTLDLNKIQYGTSIWHLTSKVFNHSEGNWTGQCKAQNVSYCIWHSPFLPECG